MKSLVKLKPHQKAKIIHRLFPGETAEFIEFVKVLAYETIDDKEEIQRVWGNQVIEAESWNSLARLAHERINYYGQALIHCKRLFAKALFKKQVHLFTLYSFKAYAERDECSPKFKNAVAMFFNV